MMHLVLLVLCSGVMVLFFIAFGWTVILACILVSEIVHREVVYGWWIAGPIAALSAYYFWLKGLIH